MPNHKGPDPITEKMAHNHMKYKPQVSVIISTYNRLDLLKQSIQSILMQTYQDFIIIIVDDHSSEKIYSQILALKNLDNRIEIFRTEENVGNNEAKNLGISKAVGNYVAILDDDDIALPHRLATQVKIFENDSKIGVVGSQVKNLSSSGVSLFAYPSKLITKKFPMKGEKVFRDIYLGKYNIPNSSLMIRKNIIKKWGYPATKENGGDMTMLLKIAAHGVWFDIVSEPLVHFRKGDGHNQMTGRPDKVNSGRVYRNQMMRHWLEHERITKFGHLHKKAGINAESRFLLESAIGNNIFAIIFIVAKAILNNPLFVLYKLFFMIPQSTLKLLRKLFPDFHEAGIK